MYLWGLPVGGYKKVVKNEKPATCTGSSSHKKEKTCGIKVIGVRNLGIAFCILLKYNVLVLYFVNTTGIEEECTVPGTTIVVVRQVCHVNLATGRRQTPSLDLPRVLGF